MFADSYFGLSQAITNQITESAQNQMNDYIEIAAAVVGAIIAGLIGWWASIWQNSRNAKDQLRIFIHQKIAAVPNEGCLAFYKRTKDEIRNAVFGTVPFVWKKKRLRLNRAWQEYEESETKLNDESDEYNSLRSSALVQDDKPPIEIPSEVLKKHLESFIKAVSWRTTI
jgi:hypothetical protein